MNRTKFIKNKLLFWITLLLVPLIDGIALNLLFSYMPFLGGAFPVFIFSEGLFLWGIIIGVISDCVAVIVSWVIYIQQRK
jgi:hypothetical protein